MTRYDVRRMDGARSRRRRAVAHGIVLAFALLVCRSAFALDPALDISQYAHTSWKNRDGFSKGRITTVAQSQDGYLWIGTELGLSRFDGVRNLPWQPPPAQSVPGTYIRSLLAARDGRLWIATTEGLASWKDGILTAYPEFAGQAVNALVEDRAGTIWAGGQRSQTSILCAIQNERTHCDGQDRMLGRSVGSLFENSNGSLWAGTNGGLWRWAPGVPQFYPLPDISAGLQVFAEGDGGSVLIGTQNGIKQLVNGKFDVFALPKPQVPLPRLLRDRDGNLWIGTSGQGLLHVHHGRMDVFTRSDGLSGDNIQRLFEDREGNIWVATSDGLDRFREYAVPTYSVGQGLSNAQVSSVLASNDGTVWLRTPDGLNRWINGQITAYSERSGLSKRDISSIFQDERGRIWIGTLRGVGYLVNGRFVAVKDLPGGLVNSITQDTRGNLWIVYQDGIFRLLPEGVVQQISSSSLGHKDPVSRAAPDLLHGGLWLGFSSGGVSYFADGQIRASYSITHGLGKGRVNYLRGESDGTLWAATEGGLSRLKGGRVATLTSKNGLPCDSVDWVIEDDLDSSWLSTVCGLVRIDRSELNAWMAAVDKDPNANRMIRAAVFDNSDGVRSGSSISSYSPHATKSLDGKLWFAGIDGVNVVDPRHLSHNPLPPPVAIEQITADRKIYDARSDAAKHLPPLVRDLVIDYTALSFAAPEKVLFRYKLEGHDRDWQDAGTRRQAFYNDLRPGNYRFQVIASNNSGVWNETGASLDFSVAPAYYQTTWFRLSVVAAFFVLVAALYQLRLRQVAHRFDLRMQERMRVAQDLHDTLLQGCLSAAMQLHLAVDHLPDDSPVKHTLTHVQQLMTRVIDEGRIALRGLRFANPDTHDLEQAFVRTQKEVAPGDHVAFRVVVEGRRRPLHPLIRDEVYRIGREAIVNAFRHANAKDIEVEIDYMPKQLRVLVRDDGTGIDPAVASSGRDGHFGLSGMRERAERIGGRITVSSRMTAGTEVDLTVPGKVAFQVKPSRAGLWLAKFLRKRV